MEDFNRRIIGRKLTMFFLFISFSVVSGEKMAGDPCEYDGYPGICRPWKQCATIPIDAQYDKHPTVCTFNAPEPVICCTSCELSDDVSKAVIDPRGEYLLKTNQTSWNKCIDYYLELPYQNKIGRVGGVEKEWSEKDQCFLITSHGALGTGGVDAKRNQYPHMHYQASDEDGYWALLGYGETQEEVQYLSGGSVINERYILTAAHCASRAHLGPVTFAALGILKRSDPASYWQIHEISEIIRHPEYKPPSKYNDIALLKTAKRITFSEQVLPICLPNPKKRIAYEEAVATGWGTLGPSSPLADTLQAIPLKQFSNETCSELFPTKPVLAKGFDPVTQMCYGDKNVGRDTCQGDSGGPLQTHRQIEGGGPTLIGVTSYGNRCGVAGKAGVYTRVEAYMSWIDGIVWQ